MPKVILCQQGGGLNFLKGIYSLSHNLKKNSHKCFAFNWFEFLTIDQIEKFADSYIEKNDIVGVSSTFTVDIDKYNYLYELTKQKGGHFVLGGVSPFVDQFKYDQLFIKSYAENDFLDYVNIKFNTFNKQQFEIKKSDFLWDDPFIPQNSALSIELSRHCAFNCKFCSFPNRGQKLECRDNNLALSEILHAVENHKSHKFSLLCSTFNDNVNKVTNLFQSLEKLNLDVNFAAYVRLDMLMQQKQLWPLFKKYLKHYMFGIETFNWNSGKSVGKGTNPDIVKDWLAEVREYFDDCSLYSGFITGLPHSSFSDSQAEFDFLDKNKLLDGYHWNVLQIADKDLNKEFNSAFDTEIFTKHKYELMYKEKTKLNCNVVWKRPDGFTYNDFRQFAETLNTRRKSSMLGFTLLGLTTNYSIEEAKSFKMSGEYSWENLPIQFKDLLIKKQSEYWKNVGIF